MSTIEYGGKSFTVDDRGCLTNGVEEWNREWVDYCKGIYGMGDLTDEHEKVIDTVHKYYVEYGVYPTIRVISKLTDFSVRKIYELFPPEHGKGACRMAGLPKPSWIDDKF